MRFEAFSFGSICIDGTTYGYDVVIDRGRIRKRKKKPSKRFRDRFGHTPLSIEEDIPWKCRRLVIGTGTGALPVMEVFSFLAFTALTFRTGTLEGSVSGAPFAGSAGTLVMRVASDSVATTGLGVGRIGILNSSAPSGA